MLTRNSCQQLTIRSRFKVNNWLMLSIHPMGVIKHELDGSQTFRNAPFSSIFLSYVVIVILTHIDHSLTLQCNKSIIHAAFDFALQGLPLRS